MKVIALAAAWVAACAQLAHAEIVIDRMWSTTYDYSKVQELSDPQIKFVDGQALTASVNVTAAASVKSQQYDAIGIQVQENQLAQLVDTFGGGVTDSVAITLQDFKSKHPKDYDDLLHLLFSQDAEWHAKGGVGLNTVRVPLGACDFGAAPYTYDDTEDGSEDPKLELFTIKKAPKLWQTLHDIVAIHPGLKIISAPWSAPGWMKDGADETQPLFGGNLKEGMEEVYANYLVKAVSEIKQQEKLDIYALSLLNEPQIQKLEYPTMKMSATQAITVGKLVRTALNKQGFEKVKLLTWDHNWDNTEYALQVLNADPTPWDGTAWHGYAGQPSSQKVVHDAYPDKETYFTEYTEVTQYFSEPYKNMKNTARNLLIGSIRYYSRSVVLWNLVLRKDEDGFTTPHLPNVCQNCNAAVLLLPDSTDALAAADPNHTKTVAEAAGDAKKDKRRRRSLWRRADDVKPDTTTQELKPQTGSAVAGGGEKAEAIQAKDVVDAKKTGTNSVYETSLFKRSSDFSVLSHLSTAVRPTGASKEYSKRIGVSSTDEITELGGRLLAQAFRQDGVKPGVSRFSLVLLNQNDHYETDVWENATAVIAFRGQIANVTTLPGLYTLSWEAPTVDTSAAAKTPLPAKADGAAADAKPAS
ncbi:glycoside hydrolase [Moesziomyces antarcticus]|uniref:Related to beta-1,6-glucanase n=2 Tax=Pseudozyma antarctica TaxID=84753 RepID=A0A5C3FKI3_PSEA2|nr:glycoside hydrolase [Moesziomyces antarcticus]GAK63921.1 glycoside hydrolase [Moesziomyces antarcticus]SPO44868.1 related to beta-1,6-glucanase precursor [Moesziomyces antarcticus]